MAKKSRTAERRDRGASMLEATFLLILICLVAVPAVRSIAPKVSCILDRAKQVIQTGNMPDDALAGPCAAPVTLGDSGPTHL